MTKIRKGHAFGTHEFSSTLYGNSIDEMEKYLIKCDAFKEPKDGKLKILEQNK